MVIQISQILQILSNLKLPAWIIGSIIWQYLNKVK